MSNYYQASKALVFSSIGRASFELSEWGWVLIAIIAVIAADTLLATGAWLIAGYILE